MSTSAQRKPSPRKIATLTAAWRPWEGANPLRLLRNAAVIGLDQVGLDLAFHFALFGIITVGIGLSSTAVRAIQTGCSVRTSFLKERFTVSDHFNAVEEPEKLVLSSF